jgi:2-polyprenyl-6-methoxyphenol hydroxylase-like FAD-dependent oxidoreductase
MHDNLPAYYGEIVEKTQDTYVQLIYTAALPAYNRGRMCLIGDAGVVAPPFTGSGVFKGYNNVKDLLEMLNTHETIGGALQEWSDKQVSIAEHILILGDQMEKAFIWDSLDIANANAETTAAWWKESVTFPEEFSYAADEE